MELFYHPKALEPLNKTGNEYNVPGWLMGARILQVRGTKIGHLDSYSACRIAGGVNGFVETGKREVSPSARANQDDGIC